MPMKTKEAQREYDKLWVRVKTAKTLEEKEQRGQEFRMVFPERKILSPEERSQRKKERHARDYNKHKKERLSWLHSYRDNLKIEALSHYSKSTLPCCECCKERIVDFLTLDHINGGGNKARRLGFPSGSKLYYWLKKNNYPSNINLRVLCWNCNCGQIGNNGVCPHKKLRT